jgi:hypothetical protein
MISRFETISIRSEHRVTVKSNEISRPSWVRVGFGLLPSARGAEVETVVDTLLPLFFPFTSFPWPLVDVLSMGFGLNNAMISTND